MHGSSKTARAQADAAQRYDSVMTPTASVAEKERDAALRLLLNTDVLVSKLKFGHQSMIVRTEPGKPNF